MVLCNFAQHYIYSAALQAAKAAKIMPMMPNKVNLFNLCAAVNEDMLNALFSPLGKVLWLAAEYL